MSVECKSRYTFFSKKRVWICRLQIGAILSRTLFVVKTGPHKLTVVAPIYDRHGLDVVVLGQINSKRWIILASEAHFEKTIKLNPRYL